LFLDIVKENPEKQRSHGECWVICYAALLSSPHLFAVNTFHKISGEAKPIFVVSFSVCQARKNSLVASCGVLIFL
jgi:hypothetical protein